MSNKATNSYTGVNITGERILLSNIRIEDGQINLENYKSAVLPAGFVEHGKISGIEIVAQTIKKVFQEQRLETDYLSVTVPSKNVVSKITEAPRLRSKRELMTYLKSDVEDHPVLIKFRESIPTEEDEIYDEEDLFVTYTATEFNEETEKTRYFVLAAPYTMLNTYLKVFSLSDRVINSFSGDVYGVISAIQLMNLSTDASHLLIYISDYNSEFMVVKHQSIYFYHKAQINAEALLKYPNEVIDLFSRTKVVMMSYEDKYPDDQRIEKVVIVASNREVSDIFYRQQDELYEKFEVETVVFNPLDYIAINERTVDKNVIANDIYPLIPSLGVSIAASKGLFVLDFFKHRSMLGPVFALKDLKFLAIVASIAAILVGSVYFGLDYTKNKLKDDFEALRVKITKTSSQNALDQSSRANLIINEIAGMRSALNLRKIKTQYYDAVAEMIPDEIWLKNITLKTDSKSAVLFLAGSGINRESLSLFIYNLKKEFDEVNLKSVEIKDKLVNFRMEVMKRRDDV